MTLFRVTCLRHSLSLSLSLTRYIYIFLLNINHFETCVDRDRACFISGGGSDMRGQQIRVRENPKLDNLGPKFVGLEQELVPK